MAGVVSAGGVSDGVAYSYHTLRSVAIILKVDKNAENMR